MTARRATNSPSLGSLAFPLLLIAFALAVGQDSLGAPQLLQAAIDAWFGLWAWIGEQVGSVIADAANPEPAPAS